MALGAQYSGARGQGHMVLPMAFADVFMTGALEVAAINFKAVHSTLDGTRQWLDEVLRGGDWQQGPAIQSAAVESLVGTALDYSRSLYEITVHTQEKVAGLMS